MGSTSYSTDAYTTEARNTLSDLYVQYPFFPLSYGRTQYDNQQNQAPWKDILAVYATRVSNGNTEEVMTITPEKKKILDEIGINLNKCLGSVEE